MKFAKIIFLMGIAAISLICTSTVFAKIASFGLDELIKESDLIVVARVTKVSRSFRLFDFPRYADVKIIDVLKGTAPDNLSFLATPSWICDTSDAIAGETVVLFLNKEQKSQRFFISHDGHGRMPLQIKDGKSFISLEQDIKISEEASVLNAENNSSRSIELNDLKVFIDKVLLVPTE